MKKKTADLAIFGGEPLFNDSLHVGKPNIGNQERLMERIQDILNRRWLTNNGRYVREFEERIADFLGVKNCVAMCNGTVALEIAARALGLTGEVIAPSFTFIATAHSLQWQGITPVFCDIDPKTHNIDPDRIERLITPRTSGIIGVHLWGRPCRIDALQSLAEERGLKLLFDASHAFGSSYQGRRIGSFGHAETFSFHATKFLNSFEGGAVVTNDDQLAKKMRLMKNFGFGGVDDVIYIGTNGKMSEISAAMGIASLEYIDAIISQNQANYKTYQRELRGLDGVEQIAYNENEKNNFQYIVLEIDAKKTGVTRDALVDLLHAENIRARRYFYPGCHRMEPYRSYYPNAGLLLSETEKLTDRVLCLPTGTTISEEDIEKIGRLFHFVIKNSDKIRINSASTIH
ncbi:MAG: dTDP-4-dehydro-6-deoxyglucose aminotransferase [Candidatus Cloacimonetes bacterium 4572_55]|nr:MAG: dTDP-4-dehydro-6-deoxyglucose aminotransferase [Candidatus Cloacimonetes bacterium 4572_55]